MTKDLALLVHNTAEVSKDKYLESQKFIEKVAEFLVKKLHHHKWNLQN